MTLGEQFRWWGAGLIVLVLLLVMLSDVLTPFLMGAAIAYFTDPLADRLEKRGLSRVLSTVLITAVAVLVAVAAVMILIPLVSKQVVLMVEALPEYAASAKAFAENHVLPWLGETEFGDNILSEGLSRFQTQVQDVSSRLLQGAWSLSLAGFELISLALITPVVAFYLLLDWDKMVARIDDLLPRDHIGVIRKLAMDANTVLAGFVRGQLTVCMILGVFYAMALMLAGLPFGLLIGLFAGVISFIPFVGSILGGLLSVGVAAYHFWDSDPVLIGVVAVIFAIGQVVEGNFLSPKLVGGSVGLHPVWLMFALSAFGALFGFAGLLVAVPIAAVIGVFLRFSLDQYKASRLYRGLGDQD
ncbi:MAG: AI-2E family transporter [Pikeienuella sp.]